MIYNMCIEIKFRKLLVLGIFAFLNLQGYSQVGKRIYEYKIIYNGRNGEMHKKTLIGINYFNSKKLLVKKLVLGPGKKDSCWSDIRYDKNDSIKKQITTCYGGEIVGIEEYFTKYDSKENVISILYVPIKPSGIYSKKTYYQGSLITKYFYSLTDTLSGKFSSKDIEKYDSFGRKIFEYSMNEKGDTIFKERFLFLSMGDTSFDRNEISKFTLSK